MNENNKIVLEINCLLRQTHINNNTKNDIKTCDKLNQFVLVLKNKTNYKFNVHFHYKYSLKIAFHESLLIEKRMFLHIFLALSVCTVCNFFKYKKNVLFIKRRDKLFFFNILFIDSAQSALSKTVYIMCEEKR